MLDCCGIKSLERTYGKKVWKKYAAVQRFSAFFGLSLFLGQIGESKKYQGDFAVIMGASDAGKSTFLYPGRSGTRQ